MRTKFKSTSKPHFKPNPLAFKERLSEIGDLMSVAIRRLVAREERANREFPLDSNL